MEDKEIKITIEKGPTPDITPLQLSYGTYVHIDDYMKLFEDWNKIRDENTRLKQWDTNKDTRNSRQRIANKKLLQKIEDLQEDINELEALVVLRLSSSLITKFDMMYSHEKVQEYKKIGKHVAGVMPDAEEVYRRYFFYKDRVSHLISAIERMKLDGIEPSHIVHLVETNLSLMQKEEKLEDE